MNAPTATTERVYLTELAQYLHHNLVHLRRFAKKHGLLRTAYASNGRVAYVSPYGAQRIIAYIRAIQGEWYLQGQDFHHYKAQNMGWRKRPSR